MPIGNGDTAALVWPDLAAGTVHVQVAKQDAMGSDMALLKLGSVALVVGLPLQPAHFRQTLDLATATVTIEAGATAADASVVAVWVDAAANCVRARVSHAAGGSSLPLAVELSSVRSAEGVSAWDTGGGLNNCTYCTGTTYEQPPDAFDDAPERTPTSPLIISHANPPRAEFSIVEAVLVQQGLGHLVQDPSIAALEQWSGRTFGMAVSGAGLQRINARFLASASDAASHELTISTLSSIPLQSHEGWRSALLEQHHRDRSGGAAARTAHERWWRAFWSRSHVRIGAGANASKAPDAAQVSMQYANARYLQIIQSRGQWPIKFVRPQH